MLLIDLIYDFKFGIINGCVSDVVYFDGSVFIVDFVGCLFLWWLLMVMVDDVWWFVVWELYCVFVGWDLYG